MFRKNVNGLRHSRLCLHLPLQHFGFAMNAAADDGRRRGSSRDGGNRIGLVGSVIAPRLAISDAANRGRDHAVSRGELRRRGRFVGADSTHVFGRELGAVGAEVIHRGERDEVFRVHAPRIGAQVMQMVAGRDWPNALLVYPAVRHLVRPPADRNEHAVPAVVHRAAPQPALVRSSFGVEVRPRNNATMVVRHERQVVPGEIAQLSAITLGDGRRHPATALTQPARVRWTFNGGVFRGGDLAMPTDETERLAFHPPAARVGLRGYRRGETAAALTERRGRGWVRSQVSHNRSIHDRWRNVPRRRASDWKG